ncbi:MAG: toxin-antitoxin system YwqK family antitoxin [Flavobacteriales bacterium]
MRGFFSILFLAAFCYYPSGGVQLPPDVLVLSSNVHLKNNNGCWMYRGEIFSGYIVEKDSDAILTKLPVLDGKEHGVAYGWFKNGRKKYERGYSNGNREGYHKNWYQSGTLAFEYFFRDDKLEGEQRTYYESGHLWQCLHYVEGHEEGKQISKNDDGRVVNNYTIKNGKLYGVVGRFDCMSVHKE